MDCFLEGDELEVNWDLVDSINEEMVEKVATSLRGGDGPSGLLTDHLRSGCCDRGSSGKELRSAVAKLTRRIASTRMPVGSLSPILVSRLVPLDKGGDGVRPVGVGESLRRLVLKCVGRVVKAEVMEASGVEQVCAGHSSACEAAARKNLPRVTLRWQCLSTPQMHSTR